MLFVYFSTLLESILKSGLLESALLAGKNWVGIVGVGIVGVGIIAPTQTFVMKQVKASKEIFFFNSFHISKQIRPKYQTSKIEKQAKDHE